MGDGMNNLKNVQKILDFLAEIIGLFVNISKRQLHILQVHPMYEDFYNEIKDKINNIKNGKPEDFINIVEQLITEAKKKKEEQKPLFAMVLCKYIDELITYEPSENSVWENSRFSIHNVISLESELRPLIIHDLNTNKESTGVCIAPRFRVSNARVSSEIGGERNLYSRDALYGINGLLQHVMYYPYDESEPNVSHIILPERVRENSVPEHTKIAFAPLSDRKNMLILSEKMQNKIFDIPCEVIQMKGISDEEHIEKQVVNSWKLACELGVDIYFAPEMLATAKMVEIEDKGSLFLEPLLMQAVANGKLPPRLTIMPTFWKNETNSAYVFDEMGRLCGVQNKGYPYVNVKKRWVEGIRVQNKPDVLLIHIINQQRIAIVICAEFLANSKFIKEFICEKLGATLVLIPAYSEGEQDFLNGISTLRPYGTTVVWGNYCGAPYVDENNNKRVIGGVSYAGMDSVYRMGKACICNFKCKQNTGCIFLIKIPTNIIQTKPETMEPPKISHYCQEI